MANSRATITVQGGALMAQLLGSLGPAVAAAVTETIEASATGMLDTAQQLVPVRTGALRNGLRVEVVSPTTAGVASDQHYWFFVEYGTVHMPAHPFLRPAAEREEPLLAEALGLIATKVEHGWKGGAWPQLTSAAAA